MEKLIKKIKIATSIQLVTGLHIGGSSENVEIGGIDNGVVKLASRDNQPYIPGSSLKGKMRCLLEQIYGNPQVGGNPRIDNMFGASDAKHPSPSKVIFRDSYLQQSSVDALKANDNLDMPYTECKFENVIDRIKGTAEHPRQTERVPAGATFDVEMIINVWDTDNENEMLDLLEEGIKALENDYLGGSGSRGYGQIKFGQGWRENIEPITFNNQ